MENINLRKVSILDKRIKLSIVLILMYSLRTTSFLNFIFGNFSIPQIKFAQLWFFLLPGIYILSIAIKNNRLRLNYFVPFIIVIVVHNYMEFILFNNSDRWLQLDLVSRTFYLYLTYLFLINTGRNSLYFILRTTVIIILFNTLLIYLDFIGIINVGNISEGYGAFEGRLQSDFNLNVLGDMNVFAIYCLGFIWYLKYPKIQINGYKLPILISLFFLMGLPYLNSTRGSIILFFVGLIIFVYIFWKKISLVKKFILFISIFIIFILQIGMINIQYENITVIKRINQINLDEGRLFTARLGLERFSNKPLWGTGYNNVLTHSKYGGRSNVQYIQILASGGIIFTLIFFFFIYRMFAGNFLLLKKNIIVFSIMAYVLILFFFRRPDAYFGIMAYIVYDQHYNRLA